MSKEIKVCEECKLPIDEFSRYCSHCGREQENVGDIVTKNPKRSTSVNFCVNCSESISEGARFCPYCGFDQELQPERTDEQIDHLDLDMDIPRSRGGTTGGELLDLEKKSITGHAGSTKKQAPSKRRKDATLLAIFLGGFGLHKFYLGKFATGIVYLIFCWTLIPIVLGIIEGFIYLSMKEDVFQASYPKK